MALNELENEKSMMMSMKIKFEHDVSIKNGWINLYEWWLKYFVHAYILL